MGQGYVVAALYKFARLDEPGVVRDRLQNVCDANGVMGTLLVAREGINGTIAGAREGIDVVLGAIREVEGLADLEHKESIASHMPFKRMKVRVKSEIVTMGVEGVDPNETIGQYVEPEQWNDLIQQDDVVLVDTRNDYEVMIGTFQGAIDPKTATFREFPQYVQEHLDPAKHKKVAMFCTGGIRCEKATSLMKQMGFEEVYHLRGGILKYLERVPKERSLWEGECFVFDERVSVGHGLVQGEHGMCYACGRPVSSEDEQSQLYERGVSCPRCYHEHSEQDRASARQRQKQIDLARQCGGEHLGVRWGDREGKDSVATQGTLGE